MPAANNIIGAPEMLNIYQAERTHQNFLKRFYDRQKGPLEPIL